MYINICYYLKLNLQSKTKYKNKIYYIRFFEFFKLI